MMQAAAMFLVAYAAAVSVVLGVLATTLIANLTTATWFRSFRPYATRVLRVMPALAGLGILLLLSLPILYPWSAGRSTISESDVGRYLNEPFFVVRFVIYWAAWITIARALGATDRIAASGDVRRATERYRRISVIGLLVLALTMTFAAFDWMMSLTPNWSSTIYGVTWFAGGMVGAFALLAVLAVRDLGARISRDDLDSLGKLLLTFILFWLYTGFAQYIVIWSGGLPREVSWFVARTRTGWGALAGVLVFGGFVFPFLVLLIRDARRTPFIALILGVVLLVVHYLDTFWIVVPGLLPFTWWTLVLAVVALIVVMAVLIGAARFGWRSSADTLLAGAHPH